ncbi:MAG: hypothetical protein V1824_03770 [archaeon]
MTEEEINQKILELLKKDFKQDYIIAEIKEKFGKDINQKRISKIKNEHTAEIKQALETLNLARAIAYGTEHFKNGQTYEMISRKYNIGLPLVKTLINDIYIPKFNPKKNYSKKALEIREKRKIRGGEKTGNSIKALKRVRG